MTVKFEEVREWAFAASMEEMKQISDLFQLRRSQIGRTNAMAFKPGDPVWFDANRRGVIHGKFVKVGRKNAEVLANDGMKWRVSPHLLHKENV